MTTRQDEIPKRQNNRLLKFYIFMVFFSSLVSLAVYIGVRNGWVGQLQVMDQVCGVFCFPHDIFYPAVQDYLGLSNEPTLFSIPLWAIVGGFCIMGIYFSLLFFPYYVSRRVRTTGLRRIWILTQIILLTGHLVLYYRITFPQI